MRSYDVAVTSLVISAPTKWTDNLLSQYPIRDVLTERRGVARRIGHQALIRIALIRQLHIQLGMGVANGVSIAAQLLDSASPGVYESGQLTLTIDLEELERSVGERLIDVLESAPSPRRGRPPRTSTT